MSPVPATVSHAALTSPGAPDPRGDAPEDRLEFMAAGLEPRAIHGVARKLVVMASGTAATVVLLLLQSVVLARVLGPSQLGQYAALMVTILLVAQVSDFGLANAFAYHARHRPAVLPALLGILGRHMAACVLIGIAVVWVATHVDAVGLRDIRSPSWFPAAVVGAIAIGTPNLVLPVLILAKGEYRAFTLFANGGIALYIVAVAAISAGWGASWRRFVVASMIVQVVVVVLELRFLVRRFPDAAETLPALECYRYALKSKWAEVMKLVGSRLDLLIVATVLPAHQVGQYSVALGFREAGLLPLRTYGGILQNLIVDRQKARSDSRDMVLATLLLQAVSSLALWIVVAAVLWWAVPTMYGDGYAAASGPAAVLFGCSVFLSLAGICFIVFNMAGRPTLSALVMTVSGLPGPLLVWVLSRQLGLYGAALAALASALVSAIVALIVLSRQGGYVSADLKRVVVRLPLLARDLAQGVRALGRIRAARGGAAQP